MSAACLLPVPYAALAGEALLAPGWYVEFGLDVPALGITDMDTHVMVRDATGQLVDDAQFKVGTAGTWLGTADNCRWRDG